MTTNASGDQCKALAEKHPTFAAPWAYSEVRYSWDMIDRRNLYDANGDFVCMVKAPTAETTDRDNLLAAAPELLEALEELWLYARGLEAIIRDGVYKSEELNDPNAWAACDDFAYNGEGASMRDQVEAAIAKARGQS